MRTATSIDLTASDRRALLGLRRKAGRLSRVGRRASIVLHAAEGWSNERIAATLNTDPHTVARWRSRFLKHGLNALGSERPRSGRPRRMSLAEEAVIIQTTLSKTPPGGQVWSTRRLAEHLGMSHSRVARVWKREGITAPWLER